MSHRPDTLAECTDLPAAARIIHRDIANERKFARQYRAEIESDPNAKEWERENAAEMLPGLDAYDRALDAACCIWREEMAVAEQRVIARLRAGEAGSDGDGDHIANAIESGDYSQIGI